MVKMGQKYFSSSRISRVVERGGQWQDENKLTKWPKSQQAKILVSLPQIEEASGSIGSVLIKWPKKSMVKMGQKYCFRR